MLAPTAWGIRSLSLQAAILGQVCSGGIRSSFFLSAGELQAPCPKKNEILYPARQHKADGACADTAQIMQGGLPPILEVPFLGIPQNWVLHVEYHIFTEISFGTLTAVLLHRQERIQITAPFAWNFAISVEYDLCLFQ